MIHMAGSIFATTQCQCLAAAIYIIDSRIAIMITTTYYYILIPALSKTPVICTVYTIVAHRPVGSIGKEVGRIVHTTIGSYIGIAA